jgi:hypothetical protein
VPDEREPGGDLREHIDAAHAAADRLVREAQARAQASDRAHRERLAGVPESGWEVGAEHRPPPPGPSELQLVMRLLEAAREAVPAELTAQLAEALRELLLAVRAVIDWYLERLEHAGAGGAAPGADERVENIPIA